MSLKQQMLKLGWQSNLKLIERVEIEYFHNFGHFVSIFVRFLSTIFISYSQLLPFTITKTTSGKNRVSSIPQSCRLRMITVQHGQHGNNRWVDQRWLVYVSTASVCSASNFNWEHSCLPAPLRFGWIKISNMVSQHEDDSTGVAPLAISLKHFTLLLLLLLDHKTLFGLRLLWPNYHKGPFSDKPSQWREMGRTYAICKNYQRHVHFVVVLRSKYDLNLHSAFHAIVMQIQCT